MYLHRWHIHSDNSHFITHPRYFDVNVVYEASFYPALVQAYNFVKLICMRRENLLISLQKMEEIALLVVANSVEVLSGLCTMLEALYALNLYLFLSRFLIDNMAWLSTVLFLALLCSLHSASVIPVAPLALEKWWNFPSYPSPKVPCPFLQTTLSSAVMIIPSSKAHCPKVAGVIYKL